MDKRAELGRRDFIHRLSATLGAVATTYRKFDLLDEARLQHAAHAPLVGGAGMTWLGDAFADNGELQQARRLGLELFEGGEVTAAFDLLLRGAMSIDAPERPYRHCLEALAHVSRESGRARSTATIAWYLDAATPFVGEDPRDAARTLGRMGDHTEAARRFEEVGFIAHAADMHEAARNGAHARELWWHYADPSGEPATDEITATSMHVHRALAAYNVARNARASKHRTETVARAMGSLSSAVRIFDVHGHERQATVVSELLDDIAAREGADVPRSSRDPGVVLRTPIVRRPALTPSEPFIIPLLDLDHAYDPIEICAPPLVDGESFARRVSPEAALTVRRRSLVIRLLALEVASRIRAPADQARLEIAYAIRLGQLGDRRVLVALLALGNSDDPTVRSVVLEAMREAAGDTWSPRARLA